MHSISMYFEVEAYNYLYKIFKIPLKKIKAS